MSQPGKTETPKIYVDKNQTKADNAPTVEERLPSRTRQDMINHRRMLIGMLKHTEQTLIRDGVKLTPMSEI
jgi:hypothetical protein